MPATRSSTKSARATLHNQDHCRLLALPRELRDRIWNLATAPERRVIMESSFELSRQGELGEMVLRRRLPAHRLSDHDNPSEGKNIAAMRATCRMMRDEATPIFFTNAYFVICGRKDLMTAEVQSLENMAVSPPLHERFYSLICHVLVTCPVMVSYWDLQNGIYVPCVKEVWPVLAVDRTAKGRLSVGWLYTLHTMATELCSKNHGPFGDILTAATDYDQDVSLRIKAFGPDRIGRRDWLEHVVVCMSLGHWLKHDEHKNSMGEYERQRKIMNMLKRRKRVDMKERMWETDGMTGRDIRVLGFSWSVDDDPDLRIHQAHLQELIGRQRARAAPLRLGRGGRLPNVRYKLVKDAKGKWMKQKKVRKLISFRMGFGNVLHG